MKVLVTGAAGFLGRHVARHFSDSGWDVTGFDLVENAEGKTIVGDLTSPETVTEAVAGHDTVIHIGAIGDVYLAGEQPALAAAVNVVGTANVIEAALTQGARVVYASTWEVYGHPHYQPIDENHPTAPDHPYNITKLAGESLIMAACRLRQLPALALRLGTAFGTGLRPNSVFRIFIDKARRGDPITIQGDGSQGRQFTHSSDIARAFEMAARSSLAGTAINIVAPQTVSIKELAQHVVERFPTELSFGPPRPGDVAPALVSGTKARDLLGWDAEVAFRDGLDDLINDVISEG